MKVDGAAGSDRGNRIGRTWRLVIGLLTIDACVLEEARGGATEQDAASAGWQGQDTDLEPRFARGGGDHGTGLGPPTFTDSRW